MTRFIVIEGGIGSGKTTLLDKIHEIHPKIPIIYEYIETKEGQLAFQLFISKKLDTISFQYYIANYWFSRLINCYDHEIVFIERGPLAALAFINENQFPSKDLYLKFVNFLILICELSGLNNIKFRTLTYHCDISEVFSTINNTDNYVLFIVATSEQLIKGVYKRNRPGERQNYNIDFLHNNALRLMGIYLNPIPEIKKLISN